MIGMGKMMWGHLGNCLGRKNVQVVAISDVETIRLKRCEDRVNQTYSERYGTDYKGVTVHRDFRELIARPDIDAIVVATPTNWHAIQSVEAMKAGKDVYCEKPLALTIREGEAIAEAARRYGRIFQVGSQQRSDFKFRFACELVRNGAIGKLKVVHVNVGGPGRECYLPAQPTPETLDWNTWLGPAPMRRVRPGRRNGSWTSFATARDSSACTRLPTASTRGRSTPSSSAATSADIRGMRTFA